MRDIMEKEGPVELKDMFEFINPTAIRIKGTRVGIEIVIEHFLAGADPREIQRLYPNLTLEQIYATITYYLFNKEKIDAYVAEGIKHAEAAYAEQLKNPSPGVKRLMKIKAELEAQGYYPT